jgi:hypothetical protein
MNRFALSRQLPGRSRRPSPTLLVEAIERRVLPATFLVSNTNDSGSGSLRQAILDTNSTAASGDQIDFQIGSGGVQTIAPLTPLPAITAPVFLNGTSQPGYNPNDPTPLIELSGQNITGTSAIGLEVSAGNSVIAGLVINRFPSAQLQLDTNGDDGVVGNYLGTDTTGTVALGDSVHGLANAQNGLLISSSNNLVGGPSTAFRNLISGNGDNGIRIASGASGNVVEGNFVGTDTTGTKPLGNLNNGISILDASDNTIGGTTAAARNVISGNSGNGVRIGTDQNGMTATANLVEGNYMGTDLSGVNPLKNSINGVAIVDASGNTIGGPVSGTTGGMVMAPGNLISGNESDGIIILTDRSGATATGNLVEGNFIGTDLSGTKTLANTITGVVIRDASNNTIGGTSAAERNLISGGGSNGVRIDTDQNGAIATGNLVEGNYIGTDLSGMNPLKNSVSGVVIIDASGNTIGGPVPGTTGGMVMAPGNLISSNGSDGILIATDRSGAMATANLVEGNYIGTNLTGTGVLPNSGSGVVIGDASGNTIGGPVPGTLGGKVVGPGNLISGNGSDGIFIETVLIGATASSNLVAGNYIGTDLSGKLALPNTNNGVEIVDASNNTVGGMTNATRNVISANFGAGVFIHGGLFATSDKTTGNLVEGNYIGTGAGGTEAGLGNLLDGVMVADGASKNTIGGAVPGTIGQYVTAPGNLISQNNRLGIDIETLTTDTAVTKNNLVEGNFIGTDYTGTNSLGNHSNGIFVLASPGNLIGGKSVADHNLVSGNFAFGIEISGDKITITDPKAITPTNPKGMITDGVASGNMVEGNFVGTKASGSGSDLTGFLFPFLSNLQGGIELTGAASDVIGGTDDGDRNIISGNVSAGVLITQVSTGNLVEGNYIGPDVTGTDVIGNTGSGVVIDILSSDNTIGGTTPAFRNVISGNLGSGITIQREAFDNTVEGDFIGTDKNGTDRPILENTQERQGNIQDGITFLNNADFNTIGGTDPGARNVISGNTGNGVNFSSGSAGNIVLGNFIGVDVSGTASTLGNALNGVLINGVFGNTIGRSGAGNLISGNALNGVQINAGTLNLVLGNRIGTNARGNGAISNGQNGVFLSDSPINFIGAAGAGNVISGNKLSGVALFGKLTSGNRIQGNLIGLDATGTRLLGNLQDGLIVTNAPGNVLGGPSAGNTIAGNSGDGIQIIGADAASNLVQGNLIGLNGTSQKNLGNAGDGVAILGTAGVLIGGSLAGEGNIISGNGGNGISVTSATRNAILGNRVGTNIAGTGPVPNVGDGVLIDASALNVIGGQPPGFGDLLSGNGQAGIELRSAGAVGNVILGNTIGPDPTGEFLVGGAANFGNTVGVEINGAQGNTIGLPGAGNLISGNSRFDGSGSGVLILGLPSGAVMSNLVQANYIGTDRSGENPLGNDTGVILNGAAGNVIGVNTPGAGNLISGNIGPGTPGIGVLIEGPGAVTNVVAGNRIGTDVTGTRALSTASGGQFGIGILISSVTTTGSNVVAQNVIAGFQVGINLFASVSPNSSNPTATTTVLGNYIGTDITGKKPLGNIVGVYINGIPRNTIGGTTPSAANVISGNQTGLYLLGSTATGNQIMGNLIGLDPSGTIAEGNHTGIFLSAASGNRIGGASPAARNVIAGNVNVAQRDGTVDGSTGIYFFSAAANNVVSNNFIGTDINGRTSRNLGQGDYGVLLFNAPANPIPTRGSTANLILGSGIAPIREFTGSVSASTTSSSSGKQTKTSVKAQGARVPSGPRALLPSRKAAAGRPGSSR